jgi:GNAT superfamily N-acetyltransferase
MTQYSNVAIRPYDDADAPLVVQLINAAVARTIGVRRAVVDAVGQVRLMRYVPVNSERVVAVDAHNVPIGYVYLAPMEQYILNETGGAVHPNHWGRGIGTELVEWATRRATELAERAPNDVSVLLQVNLFDAEQEAIQLFSQQAFSRVREWVHMVIDLDTPPAEPTLPHGLTLRPMDLDNDWDVVGPAMDAAYADHWGVIPTAPAGLEGDDADDPELDADDEEAPPSDTSYSNAPGACFIVLDGDMVVGGILCNAKLVERDDSGRVGSLFVRPTYRRQGIGRALMLAAFQAFWRHGIRRVILDTDKHSFTGAPWFYEHVGMRAYRVEWLYEKIVRPGLEVRRLQP